MRARNPGDLLANKTFDFMFENVEKQHETYNGINARLRSVPLCLGRICAIETRHFYVAPPRDPMRRGRYAAPCSMGAAHRVGTALRLPSMCAAPPAEGAAGFLTAEPRTAFRPCVGAPTR